MKGQIWKSFLDVLLHLRNFKVHWRMLRLWALPYQSHGGRIESRKRKVARGLQKVRICEGPIYGQKESRTEPCRICWKVCPFFRAIFGNCFCTFNLVLCYFQANCRILEQSNSMHWKAYVSSHMLSKGPSLCAEGSDSIKSLPAEISPRINWVWYCFSKALM